MMLACLVSVLVAQTAVEPVLEPAPPVESGVTLDEDQRTALGFGIAGVSLLAVPLAGLWAMVGALLGRKHAQLLEARGEPSESP